MKQIELYMENAGKAPAIQEAWYGYVLAYQGKQLYTAEGFGTCTGSRHRRDLVMFMEAIRRCKDCQITVHTDAAYLIGGFKRIQQYIANNWTTSTGEPVKNADLWKEIMEASHGKLIDFEFGRHNEFSEWIKTEIRRRKNGKKKPGDGRTDQEPVKIRCAESTDTKGIGCRPADCRQGIQRYENGQTASG